MSVPESVLLTHAQAWKVHVSATLNGPGFQTSFPHASSQTSSQKQAGDDCHTITYPFISLLNCVSGQVKKKNNPHISSLLVIED